MLDVAFDAVNLITPPYFVILLTLQLPASLPSDQIPAVRCFQCSEFPVQPGDRDEAMGPCPGHI